MAFVQVENREFLDISCCGGKMLRHINKPIL